MLMLSSWKKLQELMGSSSAGLWYGCLSERLSCSHLPAVCSEFARLSEKPTISREEFLPVNYDHGDKESCVLEIFGKYFSKL